LGLLRYLIGRVSRNSSLGGMSLLSLIRLK